MTLTFNPEKYKELLARHLPKVIRTEAENEKALGGNLYCLDNGLLNRF